MENEIKITIEAFGKTYKTVHRYNPAALTFEENSKELEVLRSLRSFIKKLEKEYKQSKETK